MSESIALVGLPGSGKSAVGRCIAERLGRPFVDTDDLVHRRTGRQPAELIESRGEAAFRVLELEAVREASATPCAVIATGGGAVMDPLSRWALWDAATVIQLDAPDGDLLGRLSADANARPLLRGNAAAALAILRSDRAPFYRAADTTVDATGDVAAVTGLVADALAALQTQDLPRARRLFDARQPRDHPMGPAHARIVLGRDLDRAALRGMVDDVSTGIPVVVADARAAAVLPELMAALPRERLLTVRGGERGKRMRAVERLLEAAAAFGAERGDAWICVGGGTTTDLGGTAAALYHRGAPLIPVPTTWLGQADAALGGKVAVDLAGAKNAAGAFWPPVAVVADVISLRTLPRPRLLDGMAESLKAALIGDPELWRLMEERGVAALRTRDPDEAARYAIVELSVRLKLRIVANDPYESGERRTLNLGHTLGHALEIESGYRLPHGQAVVLGIRAVAAIAESRGADRGLADRIDTLLATLGFALHRGFDPSVVRQALQGDKKRRRGRQRWILPMAVGRVEEVDDVSEAELDRALARITPQRT
ncbi:MAG: iron-containing alcohol dehydrogenase [Chloroflexota bacterium]|nr:iron-containing alcohol dehydrogenase [Chloroflexota bacterium]